MAGKVGDPLHSASSVDLWRIELHTSGLQDRRSPCHELEARKNTFTFQVCARLDLNQRPLPCRGNALAAGRRAQFTNVGFDATHTYMNTNPNKDPAKTAFLHAFHRIWSKTVGADWYNKRPWRELCTLAERLPEEPPELRLYLLRVAEELSTSQLTNTW